MRDSQSKIVCSFFIAVYVFYLIAFKSVFKRKQFLIEQKYTPTSKSRSFFGDHSYMFGSEIGKSFEKVSEYIDLKSLM